jgi:hypothetical protein
MYTNFKPGDKIVYAQVVYATVVENYGEFGLVKVGQDTVEEWKWQIDEDICELVEDNSPATEFIRKHAKFSVVDGKQRIEINKGYVSEHLVYGNVKMMMEGKESECANMVKELKHILNNLWEH